MLEIENRKPILEFFAESEQRIKSDFLFFYFAQMQNAIFNSKIDNLLAQLTNYYCSITMQKRLLDP
jgi:hypothetical protein